MSLDLQLTSNAADILGQLRGFPAQMSLGLMVALDRQNELSIGWIQARKLSQRGPTTLGVRTNRLRSSVSKTPAHPEGDAISSAIGSNVVYAAAHEYGVDKMVAVPAHTRRAFSRTGEHTTAWFHSKTGRIYRKGRDTRSVSGEVSVRTYSMHMRLPARAPFSTGINERKGFYTSALSTAIIAAWEGTS